MIATVDDGRRWCWCIPRRAEVSAKVEPQSSAVLAMLKNRLPFAVPTGAANAELVAYPMLEDSTAMVIQPAFVHARLGRAAGLPEVFAESFATALAALHAGAVPISGPPGCAGMLIRTPDAGPSEGG